MPIHLEDRWHELWPALGVGTAGENFAELEAHYASPPRAYHNLSHISQCLEVFDGVASLAKHPAAVEAAIWYHDAVYDSRAKDNESRSAELAAGALRRAGVATVLIEQVSQLILATKTHDPSADDDAPIMVDVDLSILGAAPNRFDEYERQIRTEYEWVSDVMFASGRAGVLSQFLARERIYSTDYFYQSYERQARANMKRSLEILQRLTLHVTDLT